MTEDARFEDVAVSNFEPLRLKGYDTEGMRIISSLVQDAVLPISELGYYRANKEFAALLNRFRWENSGSAAPERIQSVLSFGSVMSVQTSGIDQSKEDQILSILNVAFNKSSEGPEGEIRVTFAGDGEISIIVECLEVALRDVSRPYKSQAGQTPSHML